MIVVYNKTTLFVRVMILDTEGAANYTRSTTVYPDATFDDATISDNASAVDAFRSGSAFRVDQHPDPTTVNQVVKQLLDYVPPDDGAWVSGFDGVIFVDDDSPESFKESIKIDNIHVDSDDIEVEVRNVSTGLVDIVTATRGDDNDDVVWNGADDFATITLSFKTIGLRGNYTVIARDPDGFQYHEPRTVDQNPEATDPIADFTVSERRESLDAEFKFFESPNGVRTAFSFPKQKVKFTLANGDPGDTYTIKINGEAFSYTLGGGETVTEAVAAIVAAITGSSQPVTPTDSNPDVDVEADAIGKGFTHSTAVIDGGGGVAPTITTVINEENRAAAKGTVVLYEDGVRTAESGFTETTNAENEVTGVDIPGAPAGGVDLKVRVLRAITEEYESRINQKKFKGFKKKKKK